MILTAEPISGETAADIGLANEAVSDEEVYEQATKLAEKIVAKSKPTVTKVMELVPYAKFHSFKAGVEAEANAFGDVFGNEDGKEGISACIEERKPKFQDKELREERSMNIYVLLKRTFDTEDKIVVTDGEIEDDGAEFIINPDDEYAV